ncbi:MAG: queuosine precursor transporter [Methanosphaera sp.]|nr:queuosine precursor transporter [Methanosphaera sp.]
MFENLTKSKIYSILVGMFCALMIMSNILGTKTVNIAFIMLPCSILIFPVIYIINDVLSEIYGYKMTRNVIYLGFLLNILAIVLYTIAIILPSNSQNAEAFAMILGTTPRLFIAGLLAYFAGNILNSKVLVKLKERYADLLFVRCITSTLIGESVDSIVFITVGFLGVFRHDLIITMILCQVTFKVLYELISYPVTRKVIYAIRPVDDGELKDQI